MATQYKVKEGENLSTIAKRYGTKVSDITGYKSGNPNLIYPGEVLNIPTVAPTVGGVPLQPTGQKLTVASFGQGKPTTPITPPKTPTLGVQPTTATTGGTTTPAIVPQAQITTQPPIITTTLNPKVGVSQIDAGKDAIKELTAMGVSSDISTIRTNWSKFGLNTKLGEWIGSAVQWNAYSKYAKDELERIQKGLTEVQQKTTALGEQITKEGITPTTPITPAGGEGGEGEGEGAGAGETTTPPLTPETIDTLIDKIANGEITTPELEISQEIADLAKSSEKARVASALASAQQTLATQGMTFSSLRSDAEARIQAEHLANMSGISLKLASAIIQAARDEQSRTAPKYQAVGGSLYEIVPGQEPRKIIEGEPSAPTIIGTTETGYFQWNPQTKTWDKTGIQVSGRAPEVIGSAETGYYQWDSAKQTWVATGIKSSSGITPITIGGKIIDISDVSGLEQASDAGLDRATARAWLDINTDYTTPTIDNMLEAVWGKEMPDSVAGQQQELAKDITALDIASVNSNASEAGLSPENYIKEKIILASGFDPEDKFWEPFLKKFSGGDIGGWFSKQIQEIKTGISGITK